MTYTIRDALGTYNMYQAFIFLDILFKIRNQHKILRKKVDKKLYFLSKPSKITFQTPKLQTPIKPVGNIFDRRNQIDHSLQNGILA